MQVSIAMCTYDGAAFLFEQLQSIAAQTRLPDELVICDDCSHDSTLEIINTFAQTASFPIKIYQNETNLGSTKNFEKAIGFCSGDIIALSDQDDVWMPEKLAMFEQVFIDHPQVGMVFCDADLVDAALHSLNLKMWEFLRFTGKKQKMFRNGEGLRVQLKKFVVSGCMMAFRAEYKNVILPIPNNIPGVIHDYWSALLLSAITEAEPVSQSLIKYRQHSKQQIGGGNEQESSALVLRHYSFEEEIIRIEKLLERLTVVANSPKAERAIDFLQSRLKHFRSRSKSRTDFVIRPLIIIKELALLRYHRQSNGFYSALKDLIFS